MPYWKAIHWQEKVSDLFIIVKTADRHLIYRNTFSSESSSDKNANRCKKIFVAQGVPEIYAKSTSFKITWMCFFVTYCTFFWILIWYSNVSNKSEFKSFTRNMTQSSFCSSGDELVRGRNGIEYSMRNKQNWAACRQL